MSTRDAAKLLADAYRSGALLDALPEASRPATIDDGYDIQDLLIEEIGGRTAGWKLGLGSHKAKKTFGIGRSLAGRILSDQLYRDGAVISLPNAAPVVIEFEIAFVLNRDVLPDADIADPLSIVGETRVAFEIVLARFRDRRAVGWPSFAADNSGFQALVLGEAVSTNEVGKVVDSLSIEVDGAPRAGAARGEDETVPSASLADLITIARERGFVLPKGSIISTGSASVPFELAAPATIAAKYLDRTLSFSIRSP